MTSLKPYILFILSAILVSSGMAQGTYVPPKVAAKNAKELQAAVLQAQSGQVEPAIASIKTIIEKNPGWTEPHQELARIYFENGKKENAAEQLEAALHIDTLSQLQQLYTLGRIYEETNDPSRAMACYTAVMEKGIHQQGLAQRAMASLQALEEKNELWQSAYTVDFQPFGEDINTPNHEVLGRWTLDGRQMIFTRLVYEQEDILFASFDTTAGRWRIEDFTFNTPQNEGAHAISPDGQYLVFTSCNRQDGFGSCDLYLSFKQNGLWTRPENMGASFNSAAWDAQPCFGLDGLTLFFSSSRSGGMGGRDIWFVRQISAGKWSPPTNAGPAINTPDNEESPFVHFDGQTIYFMRDGKSGLGGYDLYIARKDPNGRWQEAENLGAPINSGTDEGALTLHPDGRRAIITRRTDQQKHDLFEFELPEPFRAAVVQALQVKVVDDQTGLPVRARLEVFETNKQDTIRFSQWAGPDGKISMALEREKTYGMIVSAEGYVMHSSSLEADASPVRNMEIKLTAITSAAEKVIVLENVFFETGSATILPASENELNKLLRTLRDHPSMKIEIRGHTDHVGDEAFNQQLSESRAKSVYEYLTFRGIAPERLTYAGFGESQPVADNATEEGRKKNRRTEFKVKSEE